MECMQKMQQGLALDKQGLQLWLTIIAVHACLAGSQPVMRPLAHEERCGACTSSSSLSQHIKWASSVPIMWHPWACLAPDERPVPLHVHDLRLGGSNTICKAPLGCPGLKQACQAYRTEAGSVGLRLATRRISDPQWSQTAWCRYHCQVHSQGNMMSLLYARPL